VETSSNKEEKSDLSVYVFAADLVHVVHRFRVSTGASTRIADTSRGYVKTGHGMLAFASEQADRSKLYRYIDATYDRSRPDANISESRRISLVTRDTQDISRLSFIPFSFLFFSFLFSTRVTRFFAIRYRRYRTYDRRSCQTTKRETRTLRVTRQRPMSMSMSNNLTAMACPRRGTRFSGRNVWLDALGLLGST